MCVQFDQGSGSGAVRNIVHVTCDHLLGRKWGCGFTHLHIFLCTYSQVHMRTHTHVHTHTHMHTYTHTLVLPTYDCGLFIFSVLSAYTIYGASPTEL